ncbi:hypothetical protein LWI28_022900 [Acer negundo]|uniref:Integrase catalytic domain-containing protein n=1 Tax=Acer negundo TaxID=4023 RepID=A0AAD5NKF3_ACENE|nr:hypothetical protein LWI28_022900 [Acer negundo]
MVRDGKTIPITYTGSTYLTADSNSFPFKHVLCSSNISQNLVSVCQFCSHNNISIEFFPDSFIVKDLTTGASLVRGQNNGNLYVWPKLSLPCHSSAHQHFASSQSTVSSQSWHFRLGHPSPPVLHKLISSHSLPVTKSDTTVPFCSACLFENLFNTRIKTVYSDGSGEAQALGLDLQNFGIQHLKSSPHTPEHVCTAERKHRHVVETALTLLYHAAVPLKFWFLAFQTAVYLINRMPTKVLSHKSPCSLLFNKIPNYGKLCVFGCLCYLWLRPYTSHKLQPRSRPCVFVGYSNEHNAYLCLDQSTSRVFVSRHVVFVEHNFPFSTTSGRAHSVSSITQITGSNPRLTPSHHIKVLSLLHL